MKTNKFTLGHGLGRPPMYETVKEFTEKANQYFEISTSAAGICKPTKAGLMYHVGFATRTSYYEYKKRGIDKNGDDWEYTFNMIERFIEACWEYNLHGFAWAGAAFALKNRYSDDWKDEVIQNQNQTVTQVTITEKKRED